MTTLLALLFGTVVGWTLGALGGGGSILIVPALVYGLSVPPGEATRLSQLIVGLASGIAAIMHWRAGRLLLGLTIALALAGIGGTIPGRWACRAATDSVIMVSLAIVLLTTATLMLRRSARSGQPEESAASLLADDDPASETWSPARWLGMLVGGLAIGFLTGFLGVGGGFLIVPVLVLVLRVPMKQAMGTSLAVISLNCLTSLAAEGFEGLRWDLAIPFILASNVASFIAFRVTRHTKTAKLQKWFAALVLAIGVIILLESVFSGTR